MINPQKESEKIRLEQTVIGRNRDGVEVYIGHEGTLVSLIKFRNYQEFFDADHNQLNPELIADGFRKEFLDKPLSKKDPRNYEKPTEDELTDNFEIEPEEFEIETGEFVYKEESDEVSESDKEPKDSESEKAETVITDEVEVKELDKETEVEEIEEKQEVAVKKVEPAKASQANGKKKGK